MLCFLNAGFDDYTLKHYTCPLCKKSLTNMHRYYRKIERLLASEPNTLPPEFANRRSLVRCNDCGSHSVTKFHPTYHKCQARSDTPCGSYNTAVLRSGDDVELPDSASDAACPPPPARPPARPPAPTPEPTSAPAPASSPVPSNTRASTTRASVNASGDHGLRILRDVAASIESEACVAADAGVAVEVEATDEKVAAQSVQSGLVK